MSNFFKNEQSGRSMVEMLGVLAIIGVLSVGGISGYSKAMAKYKLTKAQDQLTMMIMNIRTAYATSPGYPGLDNSLAADYKLVSQEMVVSQGGSSLISAFGGAVDVSAIKGADGTANGAFTIIFKGLGRDACTSLASSDWGTDGLIGIRAKNASLSVSDASADVVKTASGTAGNGDTNIQLPSTLPMSLVKARAACSSNNQNSIMWIYN